jgi:hypothetical protein
MKLEPATWEAILAVWCLIWLAIFCAMVQQ